MVTFLYPDEDNDRPKIPTQASNFGLTLETHILR